MAESVIYSEGKLMGERTGAPIAASALGAEADQDVVVGVGVAAIVSIEQEDYDLLDPAVATTVYIVTDTPAIYLGATLIFDGGA